MTDVDDVIARIDRLLTGREQHLMRKDRFMTASAKLEALTGPAGSLTALRRAPLEGVSIANETRQRVRAARDEHPTGQFGRELENAHRRASLERFERLQAQVLVHEAVVRTTIAEAIAHVTPGAEAELARHAAWDRIRPHLDREADGLKAMRWLEQRTEAARLSGQTAELEAIRREGPDYLEARGETVPKALRRQLELAAGDDTVRKAIELERIFEPGAYRASVALANLEPDISGKESGIPNVPGWERSEILPLTDVAPRTQREMAEARVAATRVEG